MALVMDTVLKPRTNKGGDGYVSWGMRLGEMDRSEELEEERDCGAAEDDEALGGMYTVHREAIHRGGVGAAKGAGRLGMGGGQQIMGLHVEIHLNGLILGGHEGITRA